MAVQFLHDFYHFMRYSKDWRQTEENKVEGGMMDRGGYSVWIYEACINANLLLRCCTIMSLFVPNERLIKTEAVPLSCAALRARLHCSPPGGSSRLLHCFMIVGGALSGSLGLDLSAA